MLAAGRQPVFPHSYRILVLARLIRLRIVLAIYVILVNRRRVGLARWAGGSCNPPPLSPKTYNGSVTVIVLKDSNIGECQCGRERLIHAGGDNSYELTRGVLAVTH